MDKLVSVSIFQEDGGTYGFVFDVDGVEHRRAGFGSRRAAWVASIWARDAAMDVEELD